MSSSNTPEILEGALGTVVRNTRAYEPYAYHSLAERIFSQTCSNFFSTLELTKAPSADGKTMNLSDLKLLMAEVEIRINGQTESRVDEEKNGEASEEGPGTR